MKDFHPRDRVDPEIRDAIWQYFLDHSKVNRNGYWYFAFYARDLEDFWRRVQARYSGDFIRYSAEEKRRSSGPNSIPSCGRGNSRKNGRRSLRSPKTAASSTALLSARFFRRDFGHMDVQMTFDDPKYYTRPFPVKLPMQLVPDGSDVFEEVCENEKDRAHLVRR